MQVSNICNDDKKTRAMVNIILTAAKLGIHNADIANLEWGIRAGNQYSLEEHGRRAVTIRKINDGGRVRAKADLSIVLDQNVETRHYGYGENMKAEDLTLDVQEPAPLTPYGEQLRKEQETNAKIDAQNSLR